MGKSQGCLELACASIMEKCSNSHKWSRTGKLFSTCSPKNWLERFSLSCVSAMRNREVDRNLANMLDERWPRNYLPNYNLHRAADEGNAAGQSADLRCTGGFVTGDVWLLWIILSSAETTCRNNNVWMACPQLLLVLEFISRQR